MENFLQGVKGVELGIKLPIPCLEPHTTQQNILSIEPPHLVVLLGDIKIKEMD